MPGKNVVDLGVEADPDEIPEITDTLLSLGFQRQSGLAPFPPTRPLLLGSVDHDGEAFRVHLHVMPPARHELSELVAFRDALRADATLRDGYAQSKREFVEVAPDGDANLLYTVHKGGFVLEALYRLGIRRDRPTRPIRCRPARPSGSSGAGSSAGCWRWRRVRWATGMVALDPDPDCPAARRRRRDRRRRLRRRRGGASPGRRWPTS